MFLIVSSILVLILKYYFQLYRTNIKRNKCNKHKITYINVNYLFGNLFDRFRYYYCLITMSTQQYVSCFIILDAKRNAECILVL